MLWRRGRDLLRRVLRRRKRPLTLDFEWLGVYAPLAGFDWRATTIAEDTVIEGQSLRHAVLGDVRNTTFVGCDLTDCRVAGVLHCRGVSFRACRVPDDFWEDVGEYSADWYDMSLVDGEPPADSVFAEVMPTERRTYATAHSVPPTHSAVMRQRRAVARELRRRRGTDNGAIADR